MRNFSLFKCQALNFKSKSQGLFGILILVSIFSACQHPGEVLEEQDRDEKMEIVEKLSPEEKRAKVIFEACLKAHGGEIYNHASYAFRFRNQEFSFKNSEEIFTYTRSFVKEGKSFEDEMTNNRFTRTIDGALQEIKEEMVERYRASVNSVIYFATLPHKLTDAAVNKEYMGIDTILNKSYDILRVTFSQEGGGEDYDDEFYYWINMENHQIDYLAYSYTEDEGGVRFRQAYNTTLVDGILFQDYVNYEVEVGTPLSKIPKLFEAGSIKELSKIETENIKSLDQNN